MKVALFITCLADHFYPAIGEAVVRLLRRHGVSVEFPPGQTCCGQPFWNMGHMDEARECARQFIRTFSQSEWIVTPSGSCAGHVRYFLPQMFPAGSPLCREASAIASRTFEFSQFMVNVLGVTDVGARFKARAVYHNSCHMQRELGVVEEPVAMLRQVRDLELVEAERPDLCCGFGGGFSVKMPEVSTAMADEKLRYLTATGADVLVSCDAGCLMHLGGRMEKLGIAMRPMHLAELLWEGVQHRGC
ncbi:MAG TPA: (Fe-S)-binding protein [Symbiobacteriaceae bacterium]